MVLDGDQPAGYNDSRDKKVRGKNRILCYFVRFIVTPAGAAEKIAADEHCLRTGFFFVLSFCVAYSLVALLYYRLNQFPAAPPQLAIPLEKWYLVQTFTTTPAGFAGLLSYSALAYMLSKAMGGRGSFDATFASLSYTLLVPTLIFMWIPEALYAPFRIARGIEALPWPKWVEMLRVFIVPLGWTLAISTVALAKVHGLHFIKCFLTVLVASIPMALVMWAFIR